MELKRFCIGNIHPGNVRTEYMQSVLALRNQATNEDKGWQLSEYITKESGPYLDVARNFVVDRFMKTDAEVLLFVDSDIEFTPEDVWRLIDVVDERLPVVGGYYSNLFADVGVRPVAFDWGGSDDGGKVMAPIDNPLPDNKLRFRTVDCVGTGFMGIHRSLLTDMVDTWNAPSPWFAEEVMHGFAMGEDVTFCARVKSMGHPVLLDLETRVNHFKTIRITPNTTIKESE